MKPSQAWTFRDPTSNFAVQVKQTMARIKQVLTERALKEKVKPLRQLAKDQINAQ